MGFKDVRAAAIRCIEEGYVRHVEREMEKNLYAIGDISSEEVIRMLKACSGDRYEASKHHSLSDVDVHIMKPRGRYEGWYVKFYFIEPDIFFISVHQG